MILPVATTLEGVIAKVVEIVCYLEEEDRRRAHWESDTFDEIRELDDRIADVESRLSIILEADD